MSEPLRLLVYDRSCRGRRGLPGLSHVWQVGARLYGALGRLDGWRGVGSWEEGLDWLASVEPSRPIGEIQFWGHGKWGRVYVGEQVLDAAALDVGHPLHRALHCIRGRFLPEARSLWWFRTCETLGAQRGQDFARAWADFFGSRVAGHTFVIAHWQSGLHVLRPGCVPDWSPSEGLEHGTSQAPERAAWSRPWHPNTITCWHGRIPTALGGP